MDETLKYCNITVKEDGSAAASYQWEGLPATALSYNEEDVSEWSDDEIIDLFADLCGIEEGETGKVTVKRLAAS